MSHNLDRWIIIKVKDGSSGWGEVMVPYPKKEWIRAVTGRKWLQDKKRWTFPAWLESI